MNVRLLAFTRFLRLLIPSGSNQYAPKRGKVTLANLDDALLARANLDGVNLTGATMSGANLDGVIGADFTGAKNVPAKYRKRRKR